MSLQFYLLVALGLGGPLTEVVIAWWERREEKQFRIGGES
jgi:hypothetical protein